MDCGIPGVLQSNRAPRGCMHETRQLSRQRTSPLSSLLSSQPDIQPPEPDPAHLQQISDMGFTDAVARKALILSRNRVAEAIEWLLMHSEDADVEAPVTQEQLRRVRRGMRWWGISRSSCANGLVSSCTGGRLT